MIFKVYAVELGCEFEDQRDFTIAYCRDEQAAEILKKFYTPEINGDFLVRARPEVNEQRINELEKMFKED